MPHVAQSNSALARVETYVLAAKRALEAGQLRVAEQQMDLALGAMTFAANSQTKLIEAVQSAAVFTTPLERLKGWNGYKEDAARRMHEAVAHAESPGID